MTKNFYVASIVGLVTYLLASLNPQIGYFALIFVIASFVLGFLVSYESQKRTGKVEETIRQLLEFAKKSSDEEKSEFNLFTTALFNNIQNTKESQDKVANKLSSIDETIKDLGIAVASFNSAINDFNAKILELKSSIGKLNEKVTTTITDASSLMTNTCTRLDDSFKESVKTVKESFDSIQKELSGAVSQSAASMKTNTDNNIAQLKCSIETLLNKVSGSIDEYHNAANKSITSNFNQGIESLKSEIAKLNTPIKDAVDDLKTPIEDIVSAAGELKSSVSKSLEKIENSLIDSYNECTELNRNDMKDSLSAMEGSIEKMVSDLTELALKFTDYGKEMEIVNRLEKLCK